MLYARGGRTVVCSAGMGYIIYNSITIRLHRDLNIAYLLTGTEVAFAKNNGDL